MDVQQKKKIVEFFIDKNILVTEHILERIETGEDPQKIYDELQTNNNSQLILEKPKTQATVRVLEEYEDYKKKREVQDFVGFFNARYKKIEKMLRNRPELSALTSIQRIQRKRERETVALIGLVYKKSETKNGIMLTVEDPTGMIKVYISQNRQQLYSSAKDVVVDEVIGIVGMCGNNIVFANAIYVPDIPSTKELKKCDDEVYVAFLSDIHVGSKDFLSERFQKFIDWTKGEIGNEDQKRMANKLLYVVICGDLVDGVGIYPNQYDDLSIKDINDQYTEAVRLLKEIPSHIQIIFCPGNHDAMRVAEPQLPPYREFAEALYEMENILLVTNPSLINIHFSENFSGFDILLYHGYSLDYYARNVESIRVAGGYENPEVLMKFLLQRRHLAPAHGSTLYIPDPKKDPLVIEKVPDFFITGHIHYSAVQNYHNITMICGSCFQGMTDFQEKVGHHPVPGKVPVVNLQTRHTKVINF